MMMYLSTNASSEAAVGIDATVPNLTSTAWGVHVFTHMHIKTLWDLYFVAQN